jgi:hypothetical protein
LILVSFHFLIVSSNDPSETVTATGAAGKVCTESKR